MEIGGEYKLRRTDRRAAWERLADELKLDRARLIDRVVDLAQRAPNAFARAAADRNVEALESDLPGRLLEAVVNRCRLCAALLA